jgi:Mg2+-importing ATPase
MLKHCKKNNLLPDADKPVDLSSFTNKDTTAVLKLFHSRKKGLDEAEVRQRLLKYGHNILVRETKTSAIKEFLSKFKSPLIILLLVAAFLSMVFGEQTNAFIIIIMVVLSAVLDYFEEHHANKSAKKLFETIKIKAMVRRHGREKEIKVTQLVPGDIIILNSGDLVPADARLIFTKDLYVNQASLTGESLPAGKDVEVIGVDKESLIDFSNMIFAGTNVVSGEAEAVVVAIGKNTELGKISTVLERDNEKSEFEIGITQFGLLIMKIIMFLVLFIFLFNAFVNHKLLESFLFAIAIAVGVTPELLPVIMSVTMARGSVSMAKKGAIVKKLSAISSFGSMDILCTDKTGTLTEGKISLVKHVNVFGKNSEKVLRLAYLNSYFQTGIENPLDEAVKGFRDIDLHGVKKIDEIPFDFIRKRLSVIVEEKGEQWLITKGAPEEIFSCVEKYEVNGDDAILLTSEIRNKAIEIYKNLSTDGFRVLALAAKKISDKKNSYHSDSENQLVLFGFIGFLDPPKKGVKESIDQLEDLGIEIKVITGDNELVAKKTCLEIGINVKGIMLGEEVHKLDDYALKYRVEEITIFARFSPDEKNRVITALRANDHVVGYIGDGINDAPSLKTADVGISVNNAVDVAKESAVIILTNKSLNILSEGVIEGRKVFGNTMKYIMMGLSSNFGNMFSAAGAVIFLPFLPMKPLQILLNNFIYDASQITIPSDNVDEEWTKKARRWDMKFIKRFMFLFGPISSLFDFFTFFLLYYGFHLVNGAFQTGWFLESLATQTLVIHIIRSKKISFFQTHASWLLTISTFGAVMFGWILPFTPLAEFFGLVRLPRMVLIALVATVFTYLLTVEFAKRYFYKKQEL